MYKQIDFAISKEKIESLIKDYKLLKAKLNSLAKELEEAYSGEDTTYTGDLNYLYTLEDRCFSAVIDAVCCYTDIVTLLGRLEETDENALELRRLNKEVDKLEEIEAQFFFDYMTRTEMEEI